MDNLLNDVIAKGRAVVNAHYANEPTEEKIESLDIAIREAERLRPEYHKFEAIHHVQYKQISNYGDKQRCHVWLGKSLDGRNHPYISYSLRTLTANPAQYGHIRILRFYKGLFYIEMSLTMHLASWGNFFVAANDLKKEIEEALNEMMTHEH